MTLAALADESAPLWLRWNFDPILTLGLALLIGAYFYALGPLRRRYGWAQTIDRVKVFYFVSGFVILVLALISPLDALSDDYLFSAHMVQHMLIAVIVPPLLLLGTPGWMIAPLFKRRAVARVARWIANPIVAFGLFNLIMWVWHAPVFYDATLSNDTIHIFVHLLFIVTGVIFWLPILSPVPEIPRIPLGFGVLYLFLGCQPMVALGALLTFAAQPLYQPYVTAPRIWGSTPLGDQQLGGLIMWLPTNIPYVIGLSALFFRWVGEQDRAERAAAGEFDFDEPDATIAGNVEAAAPDSASTVSSGADAAASN